MRRERLGAPVGHARVGVHGARCDLGELAHVPHEHKRLKAEHTSVVKRLAQEVRAAHDMCGVDAFPVLRPVLAVVSRHEHEVAQALCASHAHLQADGLDEGLLAHGPHNA